MSGITLAQALAENRIYEFIAQAEAEGIGPADRAQFETLLGRITAPQPEGQTSRSPARGSKRGK
jgi:hypothetical protein